MGAASREIERMYSRGRLVMLLLLVSMLMSVAMGRNPGGNKKKRRNNNRSDKEYRNAFAKCEKNSTCTALVKEEVPRCALQCMSSSCYTQVYGDDQVTLAVPSHLTECSSSLESWTTTGASCTR